MHTRLRSFTTAGVALAGASVIAVAPSIAPPPLPDIAVSAAPVSSLQTELAAFENPIAVWADVLGATLNNLGALGGQFLASPAPILTQLLENQLANLEVIGIGLQMGGELLGDVLAQLPGEFEAVFGLLREGQIEAAVQRLTTIPIGLALPLLGVISPVLLIAQNATANLARVAEELPNHILGPALGALMPIVGTANAFGSSAQVFYDAVQAGDFETAASALVNLPAVLTGAFLNGFGDFGVGLLTVGASPFTSGPISAILSLREALAAVIQPIDPGVLGLSAATALRTAGVEEAQQSAAASSSTDVGDANAGSTDTVAVTVSLESAETESPIAGKDIATDIGTDIGRGAEQSTSAKFSKVQRVGVSTAEESLDTSIDLSDVEPEQNSGSDGGTGAIAGSGGNSSTAGGVSTGVSKAGSGGSGLDTSSRSGGSAGSDTGSKSDPSSDSDDE